MVITFTSVEELRNWGQTLAKDLGERDVVFLKGPLGAGKTTLVSAMATACGVAEEEVSSPTFALHNHMLNREGKSLHHLDGYRIEDPLEYEQIGLDMLPLGLTFVEWPEKCELLKPTMVIDIAVGENDERIVCLSSLK